MRGILFSIVFLLFFASTIAAQKREYSAVRISTAPKIDGILSDECWIKANVADKFIQNLPDEGKDATQKTEVRIVYDDEAVYVSALMLDSNPDSILHELGVKDDYSIVADLFRIGFDTYNNQQDAYFFEVYASGVQRDNRVSDFTYNAVWSSATVISEKGWALEMKIPYSAFRFPTIAEQEWGLQITRSIARRNEFAQWALTPKNVSNSLMYWGKLKGISNIKSPLRISLNPFVSAYYDRLPVTSSDGISYDNVFRYNFGADLKYGIDDKFTLNLTLLPDFGQVQSDNKVKNLGYQEITYDENRDFFKEGTELFNRDNLFYSRRLGKTPSLYNSVNDSLKSGEQIVENTSQTRLINAAKLSGRNNNGLGIGLFNAITADAFCVIEDSLGNRRKIITEPLTNYNIFVFDQQYANNSTVYVMNTNVLRAHNSPAANVTSTGFRLSLLESMYSFYGNAILSQRFTKDDEASNTYSDLLGYMYSAGFQKNNGKFQFDLQHAHINKTFSSQDMGYYTYGNKIKENINLVYSNYTPGRWYRDYYFSGNYSYQLNPETKKPLKNEISLNAGTNFLNYWGASIGGMVSPFDSYEYYEPRVEGRFSKNQKWFYFWSNFYNDYKKPVYINLHIEGGNFIEKYSGFGYGLNTFIRYRINDRFQAKYSFGYNRDSYNIGFANIVGDDIIYGGRRLITYNNNISLSYIFKKDMQLAATIRHYWNTGQYLDFYDLLENGDLEENQAYSQNHNYSYNTLNVDISFTWKFLPGSLMSIVYKNSIEDEKDMLPDNFYTNFKSASKSPQSNSLSVKLVYYIDYMLFNKLIKK